MKAATLAIAALLLAGVAGLRGAEDERRQERLTVAVLSFENKTGDAQSAHWRHTVAAMLRDQLQEVKSVRLIWDLSEFGFRHLGLKPAQALDAEQAQKVGELIEARRVV